MDGGATRGGPAGECSTQEWHMVRSPRSLTIIALLLLGSVVASAAEDPAGPLPRLARDFKSPWRGGNLVTLGAGAALSYLSLRTENADAEANYLEGSWLEGPVDVGDLFGSGAVVIGGTAAVLALGATTGSPRLRDLGLDLASGIVVSSAYVWTLKPLVQRTRPNGGPHSFPSGHAALAFTTASVIDRHAGWEISTLGYLLAAGTAAGRVEDRRHYISDVVFGAALGLAIGNAHPVSSAVGWLTRHVAPEPDGVVVHGMF
jgi:membrane-associated phospholipid phosphatase